MRIVLDTNVVLSALLWRGTPYRLLETARQRDEIAFFTSLTLLDELAEVLNRPAHTKRLAAIGRSARQVLADYISVTDVAIPPAVPSVVVDDPDDDHVIAAAVAVAADLIVSGDRHLLALGRHETIRIVTPAEALAQISA